jgi:hypothetical protein
MRVIFVSRYPISDVGHGGFHRSYQIWFELCQLVGQENVISLNLVPEQNLYPNKGRLQNYFKELSYRIKFFGNYLYSFGNPYQVYTYYLENIKKSQSLFGNIPNIAYRELDLSLDEPVVCIVDHPNQADIVSLNTQFGIPTFYCSQNVESLDMFAGSFDEKSKILNLFPHLLKELDLMATCDERLCISKVETGLLGGLGLPTIYYPYLPVGTIRKNLETIRSNRENNISIDRNHYLMIGSSIHHTTKKSFMWFINHVVADGLPNGIKITLVGKGTKELMANSKVPPCLDVRGWLSQDELEKLMCEINGVVVPQLTGFGALTRLPELSCAGLPTITSLHSTYAVDVPPGVFAVSDKWSDWLDGIKELSRGSSDFAESSYRSWENEQPRPLKDALERWLIRN